MSYSLPDKAARLIPYEPIAGDYRVRLDANESYLPVPEDARAAVQAALSSVALNRYPDPAAAGVCARFAAYYGVDPALVTAGNGSDELISVIVNTFLQKGERAMVLAPDFSMYAFYLALAEVECVKVNKRDDFTVDADDVLDVLKKNDCRMLLFSNPCNPTGQGLDIQQIKKIICSTDALVILDEAYIDFWDDTQSLVREVAEYDNVIVLRTCSKMMGMAALRLGFAVASQSLTRVLRAAKSPYNVNTLTQAVGEAVLSHPDAIRRGQEQILRSRDLLVQALSAMPLREGEELLPTCTNFVVLRTPWAKELFEGLRERSIIVRCFPGFLRITAGSEEENTALIDALRQLL